MPTFPATVNPKPKAVIICCVDPRFQLAFEMYVREVLGLKEGEAIFLTVAGGPAPLAHPDEMTNRCRYIIRQTMFLCDHFPIELVVPMGHEDCGYYNVVPQNGKVSSTRERDDLVTARKLLGLVIPEGVRIETHYAYFADKAQTKIGFVKTTE